MKYTCTNTDCKNHNIEIDIEWDGTNILEFKEKTVCPICRQKMQCVEDFSQSKDSINNVATSKLSTMSILDRKTMLKQRSTDHYNRAIKDRKEYLDHEFIKQAKIL